MTTIKPGFYTRAQYRSIVKMWEDSGIADCFDRAEPMSKENIRRRRMEGLMIHSDNMWRDRVAVEVLENLFWPQIRCAACRQHDWDNCTCKEIV